MGLRPGDAGERMGRRPFAATELERRDRGCRLSGKVGVYLLRERPDWAPRSRLSLWVDRETMREKFSIQKAIEPSATRNQRLAFAKPLVGQ
jgi:hypothetical protein